MMADYNKRVTAKYCKQKLNEWFPGDAKVTNKLSAKAAKARYFAVRTAFDIGLYVFQDKQLKRTIFKQGEKTK